MDHGHGCDAESTEAGTEYAGLMSLVEGSLRTETGERVVAVPVACRLCGSDGVGEFEVWAGDCHCVGCLIGIGVWHGDDPETFPSPTLVFPWRLVPSVTALPSLSSGDYFRCSGGSMVFQVAVAMVLGRDDAVRRISVGLRCSEHGGLHLYIDNAHVEPSE
ncbi:MULTISPECIES: hypothetical protein [Streptomyces]|uniref:hypothetical protein n=1 Tax=Streptomyces TaxID=1883 RepID=UPI0004667A2E|nr:hypothetical protein [Streptomyces exfoliatus]